MTESDAMNYAAIRMENFTRMKYLKENKELVYKNADLNLDPIRDKIKALEDQICEVKLMALYTLSEIN